VLSETALRIRIEPAGQEQLVQARVAIPVEDRNLSFEIGLREGIVDPLAIGKEVHDADWGRAAEAGGDFRDRPTDRPPPTPAR
jgi:hypothetical protein